MIDVLEEHPHMDSFRDDLLPFLVKSQVLNPMKHSHYHPDRAGGVATLEEVLKNEEEHVIKCVAVVLKAKG